MTSNEQAEKKIKNALRDLVLIKHNGRNKTPAQIQTIDDAVDKLNEELLRLRGIPLDAEYSDIAENISDAEGDLNDVIDDRNALADHLTTAAKILGSMRSVLSLIL